MRALPGPLGRRHSAARYTRKRHQPAEWHPNVRFFSENTTTESSSTVVNSPENTAPEHHACTKLAF